MNNLTNKYLYLGISKDNFKTYGHLSVKNCEEALKVIKSINVSPLMVRRCVFYKHSISNKRIYNWFNSIHNLLNNGMKIDLAIKVLSKANQYGFGDNMVLLLESGISFGKVIELHSFFFGSLAYKVVGALEHSSSIEEICIFLGNYYKKMYVCYDEVIQKITYPLVTLFFCVFVSILGVFVVKNEFLEFFKSSPASMPGIIRFAIAFNFSKLCCTVFTLIGIVYFGGKFIDRIPFIRSYMINRDLSVAFYCLAHTIKNGASITKSIDVAIDSVRSQKVHKKLTILKSKLLLGNSMAKSMIKAGFDNECYSLIEVAESAGDISKGLLLISELTEKRMLENINFLKNYLPGLIIISTAIIVLNIFLSIIHAVYELVI